MFTAEKGFTNSSLNGWIAFEKADLNVGNGLNITDGIFRAPISGTYEFSVSSSTEMDLDFYKNNTRIAGLGKSNDRRRIGWLHQLNKGDIIRLRLQPRYIEPGHDTNYRPYGSISKIVLYGLLVHSSGNDECADGFYGPNCDECSPGYFGYPNCRSKLPYKK